MVIPLPMKNLQTKQISENLNTLAGLASNVSLLTLGVSNKMLPNISSLVANTAGIISTKVTGRSIFVNKHGEITFAPLFKTLNCMLKIVPSTILGTNIVALKTVMSVSKGAAVIFDAAINSKKAFDRNDIWGCIVNISEEWIVSLVKSIIESVIFFFLLKTKWQLCIGLIMFFLVKVVYPWHGDDVRYNFTRSATEEIFEFADLPKDIVESVFTTHKSL